MQICCFFFFFITNHELCAASCPSQTKWDFFPTVDPKSLHSIFWSGDEAGKWVCRHRWPTPPLQRLGPRFCSADVQEAPGLSLLGCVQQRTWREAHQGAVGQRVVAVHLEVDRDGVQDGLQVLLLLQAAGGVWRRGRSCKHNDGRRLFQKNCTTRWAASKIHFDPILLSHRWWLLWTLEPDQYHSLLYIIGKLC